MPVAVPRYGHDIAEALGTSESGLTVDSYSGGSGGDDGAICLFCGVPIVSNTLDIKYGSAQVPVEGGLYVMTHSSTHDKKKQLDKIATILGLELKVEEV